MLFDILEEIQCSKKILPRRDAAFDANYRKIPSWWFAYDVNKNMTMQIMINFREILMWPIDESHKSS